MTPSRRRLSLCFLAALVAVGLFTIITWRGLMPLPNQLGKATEQLARPPVIAADGATLTRSFQGRFNEYNALELTAMPPLLRQAFISAEDQHFWHHRGVDWTARLAALWSNLRHQRVVRGASTIAEQSVRILQPRPRTYWSHWLEGFDAYRLIARFGHANVLQFYLNQVPYAAQRRGVAQAAHYYFGRDPGALNATQQLALAVLVRAPAHYDPRQHPDNLRAAVNRLADRMYQDSTIDAATHHAIRHGSLLAKTRSLTLTASHFVTYARQQAMQRGHPNGQQALYTTLDTSLQIYVQKSLRHQQQQLASRQVHNAAALVIDNTNGHILAWAVAPAGTGQGIDPITTPRQPGSTLKPFVYGLAMSKLGWQADHLLIDSPLAERIDDGIHQYRNYSGKYYGKTSLRYALGNSLNIPVVRTALATGIPAIMTLFKQLGFTSFRHSPEFYGAAIALGDGEVSLLELVQAYSVLARRGRFLPLTALANDIRPDPIAVLPSAVTSLLANILSDGDARAIEFGADSLLNLPHPTAVKTGTSSDYHDSWTIGFDNRYTVGVWMGRLDGGYMNKVTGSEGAAPVMRKIFSHLRQHAPYAGLWHSPELIATTHCEWLGDSCTRRQEWLLPASNPATDSTPITQTRTPSIARPLEGERLAIDPRIPRDAQRYHFALNTHGLTIRRVQWQLNGQPLIAANTTDTFYAWKITAGKHTLQATVWTQQRDAPYQLGPVNFFVAAGATPAHAWF